MNKTKLQDRTLWYDGDSTFDSSELIQFIQLGTATSGLFTNTITDDIKQFNALVDPSEQIRVKQKNNPLDFSWNIPKEYKNLNLVNYLIQKLDDRYHELSKKEWDVRAIRISDEFSLYKKLKLLNVLRMIIFIINTLDSHKIVWGVGRGSSVSSFILYLIGAHDVDSVLYDLNIDDFLRIENK